jgi:hypothetical protein
MANPDVQQFAEDYPDLSVEDRHPKQEHTLGTRINNKVTPMGTGYPKLHKKGQCHSSENRNGKTLDFSYRTEDAYYYSATDSQN